MAKNDKLLIDGIIDDRVSEKLPSSKRDEAFEYLSFEQILKEYELGQDRLLSGSVDGRQDGGIDGFYIFINGHLLQSTEDFNWPRSGAELRLIIITCKHHDTFKQATLDAAIATLTELLDFATDESQLKGAYSALLLQARERLKQAYRKLAPRLSKFNVDVFYASRGDTTEIGTEVMSRSLQVQQLTKEYFNSCEPSFKFIGATELVELHRKHPNYTLELPFVDALSKGERYVVLAKLTDYFHFVSDEDGSLRRYLFDSNVRDFMGLNRVNEDIRETLEGGNSPDFWWLNNGVTILATSATITGKSIQADDIQIVNGLQTTESIFRHLSQHPNQEDERCVLVKVIVTKEDAIRDSIIRATNNQTDVELASLHATDKIQRDIEDIMLRNGLYYERRKNFYANQDTMAGDLVTPLYAAAGYVALVLKQPHTAAKLKAKFMRSQASYDNVFNSSVTLDVWPVIARILKRTDAELELLRSLSKTNDQFLKKWRYLIAIILIADFYKSFNFTAKQISLFNPEFVDSSSVGSIWRELNQIAEDSPGKPGWVAPQRIMEAINHFAVTRNIENASAFKALMSKSLISLDYASPAAQPAKISDEFLDKVRAALPAQPWKPGMQQIMRKQLKCTARQFKSAVDKLVEQGVIYKQERGVLYNEIGEVVSFDKERVDPDTLNLFKYPE